jgi:endoglucanase
MPRTLLRLLTAVLVSASAAVPAGLELTTRGTLEQQGLIVLLYHNVFNRTFVDQKLSGMEIILHDDRIATNGDIRLVPTPEQWDAVPTFKRRVADTANHRVTAFCEYPEQGLTYRVELTVEAEGFRVAVHLDKPLPAALVGQAGFNLEFLPAAYFGKSYILDTGSGVFPRHPHGPMAKDAEGRHQAEPLARGVRITLAPEDPARRVTIFSEGATLALYDGRNRAQNGWFVVRTLVPAGKTGNAVVWHIHPNVIPNWVRPPSIAHSQTGYHPDFPKIAVLELDPKFDAPKTAAVLALDAAGEWKRVFEGPAVPWSGGNWLRYTYARFDFSKVREPGIYAIEYAGQRTAPFRIASDVYTNHVWQPSLDTYLAVQMDHMAVREQYRAWHGPAHMDDARQAPVNHKHFDGYMQGPTTDSPYKPGQHIPGLNQGGWFDAGDFDIRTPTQDLAIMNLAWGIEVFGLTWDETAIDEKSRTVEIRRPDGVPDAVQQVEHGALQVLAQFKAIGHSIPGIIAPTLQQYVFLGDAGSKTDRIVGTADDRWAFTNRSTALDYLSAAALAAASRVLRGHDDALAKECFETAVRVWQEEHSRPPVVFQSFNTAGGDPASAEITVAVELLLATKGGAPYRARLAELMPSIRQRFAWSGWMAVRALPYMDEGFKKEFEAAVRDYKSRLDSELSANPFGVPMRSGATWGTAGFVASFGARMYFLHQAFPEIVGPEYTLRAIDYLLGTHPVSSVSYVSTIGTQSKLVAYGNNRADYTFIPGGLVPGFVVVKPDFPEIKDDWPFLWFENEYVVNAVTEFILAANAAAALAH